MGRLPNAAIAPPAFFKVLMGDFHSKVCIPRAFIKNFNGNIPKEVTLTSRNGKLWSASVKHIGEDRFICNKWSTFAEDNALQYGEFLVFKLNGLAGFSVTIYNKNACEKVGFVDPNFYSEKEVQGKEMAKISKGRPQMLLEIKKDNSNLTEKKRTPLRPIRSRVPKITSFTTTLGRSSKYQVALPIKFARENGFTENKSILLVDRFGVSWPVNLIQSKSRGAILSSGWNMFRRTKNLNISDICEFKYEERMGNALRVNTVPANEWKETSE